VARFPSGPALTLRAGRASGRGPGARGILPHMLRLNAVATLDVSAASGLVALADRICLVADDEMFLSVYGLDGTPRRRIQLFPEVLPDDHAERKRRKADLEAVALLPGGRVMAFGSGSTGARRRGAIVDPVSDELPSVVDLGPLYDRLAADVPDLNIEGATVGGDALWLLQRGNGPARFNAAIELDLERVMLSLMAGSSIDGGALRSITRVELGELDGVELSFTDAVARPDGGLIFSAAAEDTSSTYADGACAGSIIGALVHGLVTERVQVDPTIKLEGIAYAGPGGSGPDLWLVADPDDREVRASLYRATLPFR
jgi:hypothetical protein